MSIVYEKPGYVKTEVDSSLKAVIVYWENLYDGQIVKESCLAQLEQVKAGKVNKVIVESSKADGVPPQDVQEWFGKELFPQFNANGVKAIITVVPESALTKLAAKRWKNTGSPFGFDMLEVDSLETAIEQAKKY